jgi:hypothetical protein
MRTDVLIITFFLSAVMAIVNFWIFGKFSDSRYRDYLLTEKDYYAKRLSRSVSNKREYDLLFKKSFGNAVKAITLACKPIFFQMIVIIAGLQLLTYFFRDADVFNITLFGWTPSWFVIYFGTYIASMNVLRWAERSGSDVE